MIRNFHEFSVFFPPGPGMKIVWPFFEVDKLRPTAVALLNQVDAVASASEWKDEILRKNGVTTRLFRAYQGVDTEVFKPLAARGVNLPQESMYKFLALGKFEVRKGHPELVEAFKMAFPTEKDVILYMMVHNPFMGPGTQVVEGVIKDLAKGDPRVRFLQPVQAHSDVAATINSIDCGVFPTRGEGWGIPVLECLSCGKPVIATFITSHKEFLDHDVAYEVATDGLVTANDGMFFHGFGRWYEPNVKSIADQMRKAYDSKWRENPKGREKALQFPWSRSVDMLIEGIKNG
jgi:glycosyltransferase involved in cell wall biosynthesis